MQLKPFLDRWFKDGEIIAAVGVAAMHGFGEDRCTAACDGENGGFLYAGMAYHAAAAERAAGELAAEEAEATSKSKRRKRKPKGKGKKTDDATADLKPSSSASGVPPDDDDERDNSVHDGELSHSASIGIRTTRTPSTVPHPTSHQTCFCATCLNPPARYARLDDSDLDGEEEE